MVLRNCTTFDGCAYICGKPRLFTVFAVSYKVFGFIIYIR